MENMNPLTEPVDQGLTDEEIEAIEQDRKAQEEALIAPFREFRRRVEAASTELTDLQLALVEVYEQMLEP